MGPEGIRSFLREAVGLLQHGPLTNVTGLARAHILVMGLYLLVSPWLRRSTSLLTALVPVPLVFLLLAACQPMGTLSGAIENFNLPDGGALRFPRQPETEEHMAALLEGELILENGCLRATMRVMKRPVFWSFGLREPHLASWVMEPSRCSTGME
jgi:hypothetical protein